MCLYTACAPLSWVTSYHVIDPKKDVRFSASTTKDTTNVLRKECGLLVLSPASSVVPLLVGPLHEWSSPWCVATPKGSRTQQKLRVKLTKCQVSHWWREAEMCPNAQMNTHMNRHTRTKTKKRTHKNKYAPGHTQRNADTCAAHTRNSNEQNTRTNKHRHTRTNTLVNKPTQ